MAWARNRTALIGIGAVVVAVLALGVIVAVRHHRRHELLRVEARLFEGRLSAAPFGGGPFLRQFDGLPGQQLRGGGQGFGGEQYGVRPFGGQPMPVGPDGGPSFAGPMAIGALHGELTLPTSAGGYQTIDLQRGTVSQVSSSSLTVRSSDAFTKTYSVTASTVRGVQKGDTVDLRADVTGNKATVIGLADLTR